MKEGYDMEIYFADTRYKTAREIMEHGKGLKRDFQMGILDCKIGMPELWDHTLLVPGRNEIIDFTDYLNNGIPTFKKRTITITLDQEERDIWHQRASIFAMEYHGKKVNILFSNDENHYFTGRIQLDVKRLNLLYNEFTITITCNPYRYIIPAYKENFDMSLSVAMSDYFPVHIGPYFGTLTVTGTAQHLGGYIYLYSADRNTALQQIVIDEGTHTITTQFQYSGDLYLRFYGLTHIKIDGDNMEV